MSRPLALLLLLATLVAAPGAAHAREPTRFDQGRWRFSIILTGTRYLSGQYLILGGGAHFYVLDGLELGADVTHWLRMQGATEDITQVSPQVRYVFYMVPTVQPYLGAFYRRWILWGATPDLDMVGGRAGAMFGLGRHSFVAVGLVYEVAVTQCTEGCSILYPEVSIAFSL